MTNRDIANQAAMRVIETVFPRPGVYASDSYAQILETIEQALNRANIEAKIEELEWCRDDPWLHNTGLRSRIIKRIDRLKSELAKERR